MIVEKWKKVLSHCKFGRGQVPEERLREYGRQMLEFARENEAKKPAQSPALPSSEVLSPDPWGIETKSSVYPRES